MNYITSSCEKGFPVVYILLPVALQVVGEGFFFGLKVAWVPLKNVTGRISVLLALADCT